MPDRRPDPESAPTLEDHAAVLLRIMAQQLEHNQRMLACFEKKKEAIRTARIDEVPDICKVEQAIVREMEKTRSQRTTIMRSMTALCAPSAKKPLGLFELASKLDDPHGPRLREMTELLRDSIEKVRAESSIVTAAAAALNRHITGVMQSVRGALSNVGVYERKGCIAMGAQMDFCVDIKS
jgi:hypothetical protein